VWKIAFWIHAKDLSRIKKLLHLNSAVFLPYFLTDLNVASILCAARGLQFVDTNCSLHQFTQRKHPPHLNHLSLLHYSDYVGVTYCAQSMRNDDDGAVGHDAVQRVLHKTLRFRVQRARRFVQDQNG